MTNPFLEEDFYLLDNSVLAEDEMMTQLRISINGVQGRLRDMATSAEGLRSALAAERDLIRITDPCGLCGADLATGPYGSLRYSLVYIQPGLESAEPAMICRSHATDYCDGCDTPVIESPNGECPRREWHRECPGCLGHMRGPGSDCSGGCETCQYCGERGREVQYSGSTYICQTCEHGSYFCAHCQAWTLESDECREHPAEEEDDDGTYRNCTCYACGVERNRALRREGRLIQNYSYKPRAKFHGEDRHKLFLGPEIEVEAPLCNRDDAARVAVDGLGSLGYLKEDGSLSQGFEIVTHPMAYDWAIENFPWDTLTKLWDMGCRAQDSTGIHIHVSKAGFSDPGHIYRWLKLIYRNADSVQVLAGRKASRWARFSPADRAHALDFAKNQPSMDGHYPERYSAVNIQNSATFELRVFRSSLRPKRVKAFFGFAHASVEYARQLNSAKVLKEDGWSWDAFVSWSGQQECYAPFTNYLRSPATACVS